MPTPDGEPEKRQPATLSPNIDRLVRYLPLITIGHFVIGLPALIASLALAYFAFIQADATQKMQTGGAMPFVTLGTSNADLSGTQDIALSLTNNGVGPAILGPIEIRYEGKPIRNPTELLEACCGAKTVGKLSYATSPSSGIAVRPGEEVRYLRLPRTAESETVWTALNSERWKLQIRSCYCSIFNDCWITEGMQGLPKKVGQCPANWATYKEEAGQRIGGK